MGSLEYCSKPLCGPLLVTGRSISPDGKCTVTLCPFNFTPTLASYLENGLQVPGTWVNVAALFSPTLEG